MGIYQHFRKEEQPFIDQVISWKEQVERSFQPRLTDFLDPREQQIVSTIIGENNGELKLCYSGGSKNIERQRIIIAPIYDEVLQEDFQITLLQANYQQKFISLSHRDVMGAFLSLGVKREKMGDIYVGNGQIQIVVASEVSAYVMLNFTSVKHAKVDLKEGDPAAFIEEQQDWKETTKTVSSMRLDVVLKEIYRISRKEAQERIEKLHVKVNHKIVQDNKFQLQAGDLLSLRGKGRSKLISIDGETKKEKLRITIATLQ